MEQYKISGRIGQGAHGYVMKGVHKLNNEEVALKKVIIKNLDEGIPKNLMREITALKVLNNEYIVELLEVIPHGMGLILVMEFLPSNMYDIMKYMKQEINESHIKTYMKMLFNGIKFMHDNHIMHRDLKPANLLVTNEGVIKIGDFGLARIYVENEPQRQYSHQVATRWYRAPELLYGSRNYTNSVDLWAAGCIMAELINKAPLFPGETDIEQLAIVISTLGTPSEETWPGLDDLPDYNKITFARTSGLSFNTILPNASNKCITFLKKLIIYDHNERFTAKEALNQPYFMEKPLPASINEMPKPKDMHINNIESFEDPFSGFDLF